MLEEKKTRAKPGAGTGIVHPLLTQFMVTTLSVPRKRPSTVLSSPRVCERKRIVNLIFFFWGYENLYLTSPCNIESSRNRTSRQISKKKEKSTNRQKKNPKKVKK